MMQHPIVFLSDFGYRNEWVGICHVRQSHLAAAGLDRVDRILVETQAGGGLARQVATYADLEAHQWGLMVDPRGWLSVVRGNTANAAEGLGVGSGDLVWLSRESD